MTGPAPEPAPTDPRTPSPAADAAHSGSDPGDPRPNSDPGTPPPTTASARTTLAFTLIPFIIGVVFVGNHDRSS